MSLHRAVRGDLDKVHASVRFREVICEGHIDACKGCVHAFSTSPGTLRRPRAVFLDMKMPQFAPWESVPEWPRSDAQEDLWRTHYRSVCNAAHSNAHAMQRRMPQFYWRNLPEAAEIGMAMREGSERIARAHEQQFAAATSVQKTLEAVRLPGEGVQECRACDLWRHATQAVQGEGPKSAKIMLVGEQPGDEEDLRGAPFVGPAGKVLDDALLQARVKRSDVYVTNAVKHFKWEPRGKRRLHKKPNVSEIRACNMWLVDEIGTIKPRVIVALGATALSALVGSSYSIEAARKVDLAHSGGAKVLASYHPSAILRAVAGRKDELRAFLIADLKRAVTLAAR